VLDAARSSQSRRRSCTFDNPDDISGLCFILNSLILIGGLGGNRLLGAQLGERRVAEHIWHPNATETE
jgi:hypothetical protein